MKKFAELLAEAQAVDTTTAEGLAQAESLIAQAKAAKSLEDLIPPAPAPETPPRPPFAAGDTTPPPAPSARDLAVKTFFTRKFGELPAAAEQIAKEAYPGRDYSEMLYEKNAGFKRYLRTGIIENHAVAKALVMTPTQIMEIAEGGLSMAEVKATMIESSDVLGGLAA